MYRPSDKEIEAVAQILKDWKMPSGWQTAAVLALDAAAKARAPDKMKKSKDEEMVKFLKNVVGVITATSEEQHGIWARNKEYGLHTWESNNSGLGECIGWIEDRPIYITIQTNIIGGHKILFVHATSQLVDWAMVDEWIKLNLPDIPKVDATNWINVIPRKED